MSTQRPTPETDALEASLVKATQVARYYSSLALAFKLERERDEMAARIDELEGRSVHSCGDHCQRPACVKRREREKLIAEKDAQIAALRAALWRIERTSGSSDIVHCCQAALSSAPPPAVVPLEDVRPLVEVIREAHEALKFISSNWTERDLKPGETIRQVFHAEKINEANAAIAKLKPFLP